MKILHTVESYDPSVGGMQEVVKQLSEHLVKGGHSVTVATKYDPKRKQEMVNGVRILQFEISGNTVNGYQADQEEIHRYQNLLTQGDFDIMTNFAAQQWATDLAFPILDKIKAKKVFVPTGFSGLYLLQYQNYFRRMKDWMKKYDMNVFLSDDYRDVNFARKNGIKKTILIPNGASEEEFLSKNDLDTKKKLKIPQNHFLILHVGSHTGEKGHKEAIEIFAKARIRNATFLIIGNTFGEGCTQYCFLWEKIFNLSPQRLLDRKKLIITSLTRQETVSAYKEADLFLFPSNIECSPLVLFESMASKTPFLVTDVGNSKEIIQWSKSGFILPTIKDKVGSSGANIEKSINLLENIYHNPNERKRMAETGFKTWKEKFTWGKIAAQYEMMYQNLLSQ